MTEENCRKLRFGGLRLLLWFAWQTANIYFLGIGQLGWVSEANGFVAFGRGFIYIFVLALMYLSGGGLLLSINGHVEPWKEPFRFISRWFWRNVIGYYKASFYGSEIDGGGQRLDNVLQTAIWSNWDHCDGSGRRIGSESPGSYAIVETLGGWFQKSYIGGHGRPFTWVYPGWSILVDRKFYLRNWDGSCFPCRDEKEVLDLLHSFSEIPDGWGGTFAKFIAGRCSDLNSLQGSRNAACNERDKLLQLLVETVTRLDSTKRFIKSDQGRDLRVWLAGEIQPYLDLDALRLAKERQQYFSGQTAWPGGK